MTNLKNLIDLAKADGGKFFVIDETGEAKLVIMQVEEYQRLLLAKLKKQVEDVENINREIIRAQLRDEAKPLPKPQPKVPAKAAAPKSPDMREEVIDPSFDFEAPKTDSDGL